MPESPELYIDLLDDVADRLFRGDWRSATLLLADGGDAGTHRGLIDLAFCLARVVRNLQLQSVLGDVEAALEQLDAAAARLRKGGPLPLGSEPPPHLRITHLRWTTTRLVQRELADLMALRLLVEELRRGIQELVCACVEYLTLVEFDPWTVRVHRLDRELTGLKPAPYARWRSGNRLDICGRATRLRQFADVRNGSVSEKTWQRTGGYPCLRELALRVLAEEPVTRGRADLPVRLGRRRAWEYAQIWTDDTAA